MSKELNEFLSKLKLNGYKQSSSSLPQLSPTYALLLESFTSLIQDIPYPTKQEQKTYSDLIANHSELLQTVQSNKYLLETETDLTELSISSLQNELSYLDNEIALYETQIAKEEIETTILTDSLQLSNKQIEQSYLEKQLKDFELNSLNCIYSKSKGLNTAAERVLTELSLNSNQCHNPTKAIIGYTNIDNMQYNEVIGLFTSLLDQYQQIYNALKSQSSSSDQEHLGCDLKEFNSLLDKLLKVKDAAFELNKNTLLKQFKLQLEKYKNQLINEYIKGYDLLKGLSDKDGLSGYELEQLLKKAFDIENQRNHVKFIGIQNTFTKQLYDDILIKTKGDQISFIRNFTQIEKIISSIYPYLVADLQSTQDIYDNISELIEVYSSFQSKVAIKQSYLRKIYSEEHTTEKKITIDERDDIGLFLADSIIGEKEKKKGKVSVYEYGTILKKLQKYLEKPRDNEVITVFYQNTIPELKNIMIQLNSIKDHSCYLTHVIPYSKSIYQYKEYIRPIIEMFLQLSKERLGINSNYFINIYDAMYTYYNQPEIFNKECSKQKMKR